MANNDLMTQWTTMNQSAMQTFQQMMQANLDTMQKFMPAQGQGGQNLGELMKASMVSSKDLNSANTEAFQELFKTQADMMKFGASATAVKDLGKMFSTTMSKFAEQEVALVSAYLECVATYMEELKNAKTPEDLVGAQTLMFNTLSNKLKDSTMESLQTLTALKAGMNAWAENTIDSMNDTKG